MFLKPKNSYAPTSKGRSIATEQNSRSKTQPPTTSSSCSTSSYTTKPSTTTESKSYTLACSRYSNPNGSSSTSTTETWDPLLRRLSLCPTIFHLHPHYQEVGSRRSTRKLEKSKPVPLQSPFTGSPAFRGPTISTVYPSGSLKLAILVPHGRLAGSSLNPTPF